VSVGESLEPERTQGKGETQRNRDRKHTVTVGLGIDKRVIEGRQLSISLVRRQRAQNAQPTLARLVSRRHSKSVVKWIERALVGS